VNNIGGAERGIVTEGELKMPKQFENSEATKVEDATIHDASAQTKIGRVADALAAKPAQTEQKFDKENSKLFSK
jgi:hypothetical protein